MPEETFDTFAGRLDKLADALGGPLMREVTEAIGMESKREVIGQIRKGVGSDLKFSGWYGSRTKMGSGFDLDSDTSFTLKGRPRGMVVVLTDGRGKGSKVARRGVYRGRRVGWGSTKGKGSWTHAVANIKRRMPSMVEESLNRAIKHNFGK